MVLRQNGVMVIMTLKITPPPPNNIENSKIWRDWIQTLYVSIKNISGLKFTALDFSGSSITSLESRNHNDLQNIQGGFTDDYQHLTTDQLNIVKSSQVLTWLSI